MLAIFAVVEVVDVENLVVTAGRRDGLVGWVNLEIFRGWHFPQSPGPRDLDERKERAGGSFPLSMYVWLKLQCWRD